MVFAVVGSGGAGIIAAIMMLSAFDTTNSTVLTNARVYYAMARNGLFYRKSEEVHKKFQTPHIALILQGAWSIILLVTGSFDLDREHVCVRKLGALCANGDRCFYSA